MNQGATINIGTDFDQVMINKLRKQLKSSKNERLNIQPYEIIVERVINDNFSGFNYELETRQNMRTLEKALGKNDSFLMTHMAVAIYKEVAPTNGTSSELAGNSRNYHYPDPNVFAAPATVDNVSESDALESLWRGQMTAKADQDEVLLELVTYRFRKVPYFQFSAGPPVTVPSYDGQQYEKMHIPVLFAGNKTNRFTFAPAEKADLAQAGGVAGTTNVIQIVHRGYVIRDYSEQATIEKLKRMGVFA